MLAIRIVCLFLAALLVAVPGQVQPGAANATHPQAGLPTCLIPTGENGVHYVGENVVDMERWGPASFPIGEDGSYWIADTAGNQILHYGAD